jgi:hypothetical protein
MVNVCSATAMAFPSGLFNTKIPFFLAKVKFMFSNPEPGRPMNFIFFAFQKILCLILIFHELLFRHNFQ